MGGCPRRGQVRFSPANTATVLQVGVAGANRREWVFSDLITSPPTVLTGYTINGVAPTAVFGVLGNILTLTYPAGTAAGQPWVFTGAMGGLVLTSGATLLPASGVVL